MRSEAQVRNRESGKFHIWKCVCVCVCVCGVVYLHFVLFLLKMHDSVHAEGFGGDGSHDGVQQGLSNGERCLMSFVVLTEGSQNPIFDPVFPSEGVVLRREKNFAHVDQM